MQNFKDKSNQAWTIDLPVGAVLRVRAADPRFDLFDAVKGDLCEKLRQDLPLFWELLWLLVEPQARDRSLTADQFGLAMAAECLVDAQKVFFEEWRDFFRRLHRPDMETVVEKTAAYHAKAVELVRARLATDPLLTTLDQRLNQKLESELSSSLGNLGASLDRILGPSPSGSSGG